MSEIRQHHILLASLTLLFTLLLKIQLQGNMSYCVKCSQYHHTENNAQICYTFQKYTYLLKDEFMKWNKNETKMSKHSERSKPISHNYEEKFKTNQKTMSEGESLIFEKSHQSIQNSNIKPSQRSKNGGMNKRIEKVINKSRGCKQHLKDCDYLQSTSCAKMHFSSIQPIQSEQKVEIQSFDEEQTSRDLKIIPCEKLFEKPFNSRLLSNPIVYDSLKDNRMCGIPLCEQGEIEATNEHLIKIFQRMRIN